MPPSMGVSSLRQMRLSRCCLLRISATTRSAASKLPKIIADNGAASGNPINRLVNRAVAYYEECLGLSEVQKSRNDVNLCEERLYSAQKGRREKQAEIKLIQNKLKDIHSELDRTPRGEDKYLHLITEEHAAIKQERELLVVYEELENKEKDALNILSNKVRISHEREREREERTKYWSLTGSLVGALLGIVGTTVATELRMRHIRDMIPAGQEVRPLLDDMVQVVGQSHGQVSSFLDELKQLLNLDSPKLASLAAASSSARSQAGEDSGSDMQKAVDGLKGQNSILIEQMTELKRLIRLDRALGEADEGRAIVYVGDSMEAMLQQTERNIQSRMKLQTLAVVVGSYAMLAITLPLIYYFFVNR